MEPYIHTFSGVRLNPLALNTQDVRIEDIAHHLATSNRWCGALKQPVSIAQHSIWVSHLCMNVYDGGLTTGLQGLFHDASEYVLGDITRWLKKTPMFEPYRMVEQRNQETIYEALEIEWPDSPVVRMADDLMVRFEGAWGHHRNFICHPETLPRLTDQEMNHFKNFHPMTWKRARRAFLVYYGQLTDQAGQMNRLADELDQLAVTV
jgi:hypothetical protein